MTASLWYLIGTGTDGTDVTLGIFRFKIIAQFKRWRSGRGLTKCVRATLRICEVRFDTMPDGLPDGLPEARLLRARRFRARCSRQDRG